MIILHEGGVKKRLPSVTENEILGFFGPYRFLSNYHVVDVTMPDGLTYPSTENAYQAYKLLDVELRKPFTKYTCSESKKAGQTVELRSDWEKVKVEVMRSCLEVKFKTAGLMNLLQATAPKHLEETNDWKDTFWGVCEGKGQNMLGQLLMQVRDRRD